MPKRRAYLPAARCFVLGVVCVLASCAVGAVTKHSVKHPPAKHPPTHRPASQTPKLASVSAKSGPKSARSHKKGYARKKPSRVRGQSVPTTERISEIQSALAKSGAYEGDPSGKWDDNTAQAMKHFQQVNGLSPTGKAGCAVATEAWFGIRSGRPRRPASRSAGLSYAVSYSELANCPY